MLGDAYTSAASRCNFNCQKDFLRLIAPQGPLSGRAWMSYALRDDGVVPLICPTCQMFSRYRSWHHASNYLLLCMGLFSIF